MSNIIENLKTARIRAGLTEEKMAEKLGISRATLSNYECGKTRVPHTVIEGYCEYCNVSPNFIFYGEEDVHDELYTLLKELPRNMQQLFTQLIKLILHL